MYTVNRIRSLAGPLVAVVALVVASCGSDTGSSTSSTDEAISTIPDDQRPETSPPATTTPPDTAPVETTAGEPADATPDTPTDSSFDVAAEGAGSELCAIGSQLDAIEFDFAAPSDELRTAFDEAIDLIQQAIAVAPEQFVGFLESGIAYQQGSYDILNRYDFDIQAAENDPAWAELTAPGEDDFADLDAYCGTDTDGDNADLSTLPDGEVVCGYLELLDLDALVIGGPAEELRPTPGGCSVNGEAGGFVDLEIETVDASQTYNFLSGLDVDEQIDGLGDKAFAANPALVVLDGDILVTMQFKRPPSRDPVSLDDRIDAMRVVLDAIAAAG